jgi:hypothetical protein
MAVHVLGALCATVHHPAVLAVALPMLGETMTARSAAFTPHTILQVSV